MRAHARTHELPKCEVKNIARKYIVQTTPQFYLRYVLDVRECNKWDVQYVTLRRTFFQVAKRKSKLVT